MQLPGKVGLVTGASSGIGSTIARRLGAADVTVIVAYVGFADGAKATADEIIEAGGRSHIVQLDQRSANSIEQCARTVAEGHGRLDILVNNAAWNIRIPFTDLDALTAEIWDRISETNLRGPFLLSRACAELLKADGGGHIVNISSSGGVAPIGSSIAYAANKAGLNHLTRCLAVAMAPHVAVNCIASGLVENTRMSNRAMDPSTQDAAQQHALLGHTTQTADIAEQVMTFVTSTSITGQVITIDGGSLATLR